MLSPYHFMMQGHFGVVCPWQFYIVECVSVIEQTHPLYSNFYGKKVLLPGCSHYGCQKLMIHDTKQQYNKRPLIIVNSF